jgi:tRNA G18 (ribose-2'-O)-methylase SpoU
VRSVFNVGSMFRTADGFGVSEMILCGFTPTPEHPKMSKTSLGAERSVPWRREKAAWQAVMKLKKAGYKVFALEETPTARPLESSVKSQVSSVGIALVVGHEIDGVSHAVLKRVDGVLKIPMHGSKSSFNVAVAAGIGLYALALGQKKIPSVKTGIKGASVASRKRPDRRLVRRSKRTTSRS